MKSIKVLAFAVAFLVTTPLWATTIYGGFEDTTGASSDYDYNDLVFSLSGSGLTLNTSTGVWHNTTGLVLNGALYPSAGTPFWNNGSQDGANDNIGFCIYGGPAGSCDGHPAGLDPGAEYLATATGGSVNDVFFSVTGGVDASVTLTITADTDTIGWALLTSPGTINTLGGVGTYTFTPTGNFELVGIVNGTTDYDSDAGGTAPSQFAFFESAATPEPSSLLLLGTSLLGMAGIARRRFARK